MTALADIPTASLIAELERRRTEIDAALEARIAWENRDHPILASIAREWGLSTGSLFKRTAKRPISQARQAAMVILRNRGETLEAVAQLFGMDHGTVAYAARTHSGRMADPLFASRFLAAQRRVSELDSASSDS